MDFFYSLFGDFDPSEYEYLLPSDLKVLLYGILNFLIIFAVIVLLFSLVFYLFTAFGIKGLSKKTGHSDPWLAFIPFAQNYMLGSIADRRSELNGKKKTNYRVALTVLQLIPMAVGFLWFFPLYFVLKDLLDYICYIEVNPEFYSIGRLVSILTEPFTVYGTVANILLIGVSLLSGILYFIVLYNVYKLFKPNAATGLLILSIFVNVATPFVLFALRNCEIAEGSAPRAFPAAGPQPDYAAQPPVQNYAPQTYPQPPVQPYQPQPGYYQPQPTYQPRPTYQPQQPQPTYQPNPDEDDED